MIDCKASTDSVEVKTLRVVSEEQETRVLPARIASLTCVTTSQVQ